MDHQDWETYIVHCKASNNKNNKECNGNKKKKYVSDPSKKMDEKIEKGELKHKTIDNELKISIQKARLSMGLTQKDLAKRLSMPDKLINDIETGKAKYNANQISKIKRFLKI